MSSVNTLRPRKTEILPSPHRHFQPGLLAYSSTAAAGPALACARQWSRKIPAIEAMRITTPTQGLRVCVMFVRPSSGESLVVAEVGAGASSCFFFIASSRACPQGAQVIGAHCAEAADPFGLAYTLHATSDGDDPCLLLPDGSFGSVHPTVNPPDPTNRDFTEIIAVGVAPGEVYEDTLSLVLLHLADADKQASSGGPIEAKTHFKAAPAYRARPGSALHTRCKPRRIGAPRPSQSLRPP